MGPESGTRSVALTRVSSPPHYSVLAICGSLRTTSSNRTLLETARRMAAPAVRVQLFEGLGELPHFNPDDDAEGAGAPAPVRKLRERIADADALLISSPEYAHGIPGSLKNALDWLVSAPAFYAIPVAVINPSLGSTHANAQLLEVLRTMSARVIIDACVRIPLLDKSLDAAGIVAREELAAPLRASLAALVAGIDAADRRAHSFVNQ